MTARNTAFLAWIGSVFAILAVYYFQYIRGLEPCTLCQYQRIPHYAAIAFGWIAVWYFPKLRILFAIILLAGAGVAGFHVGVEYHWWEGLSTCSGAVDASSAEALLSVAPAKCDEVAWSLFGLSMAAWNGLLSLGLAGLWLRSFVKIA